MECDGRKGQQLREMARICCGIGSIVCETNCTAWRSDLTLENTENKGVIVIDIACPNEMNKEEKRTEKNQEISTTMLRNTRTKRRLYCENDTISDWCLGGGMKQLKSDLKELFDNVKELDKTVYEMQKTVLW